MDAEGLWESGCIANRTPGLPQRTLSASSFFPGARHFVITGGVFNSHVTNIVHDASRGHQSGLRTIPLGDIHLMHEIRLNVQSRVVKRFSRPPSVRRIYSATLGGREARPMTVAVYQGPGAKEQWQRHILNYQSIRHPNIMQLYGIAIGVGISAMIFHDDLIPYEQFLNRFRHSLILTTYLTGHCAIEYEEASEYVRSVFPSRPVYYDESIFWIRRSTGHLCADLVAGLHGRGLDFMPGYFYDDGILRLDSFVLDDPNIEATVISTITEDGYHRLCSRYPMAQLRLFTISTQAKIRPGAIIFCSTSHPEALFEMAHSPCLELEASGWDNTGEAKGILMANSWVRYNYFDVYDDIDTHIWTFAIGDTKPWLAQANSVFSRLQTKSHLENYIFVDEVRFHLQVVGHATLELNPPDSKRYLFVCPAKDFEVWPCSVRWPDCPAYWSFDPSGIHRIDAQDAMNLGFPSIHIQTSIHGQSWGSNVYAGLRLFHYAKGFNPESQEVSEHLGHPLYELSHWQNGPFAYVEDNCDEDGGAMCRELGHFPAMLGEAQEHAYDG
ncbi:hypothetical protein MVEN_02171400 [Mycena venus]|uniref:Uncharacterized protein n=1 Tax=Mycena venus TaxID=2733690 RepID=A0A8H7CG88_9AGAR|nr:hypothetical protein MVEN_02171400 [Mycena venus]